MTNGLQGWRSMERLLHPSSKGCVYCGHRLSPLTGPANNPHLLSTLCSRCSSFLQWIEPVECRICGRGISCRDCHVRRETFFLANRSAVRYTEAMKPWLARFKYRGDERLLELFADMMERTYRQYYHPKTGSIPDVVDWLTYVPISRERLEERGFNQAELLARELGLRLKLPVVPTLMRTFDTGKMSSKSRESRLHDLREAFALHPEARNRIFTNPGFRPICIVVIDDVYTTGSTLNECSRILARHVPARIYGLTWAR